MGYSVAIAIFSATKMAMMWNGIPRCNNEKNKEQTLCLLFTSDALEIASRIEKAEMYEKTINRPLFLIKLSPELSSQALAEAKEFFEFRY